MEAVIQSEAAECGLACIAMVAAHHGNRIGLRELRRRHALSLKGATLSQLSAIASEVGLAPRPLRLDMEHLSQLQLPCIVHWDLTHYVVLTHVGKRGVKVLDPASGKKTFRLEEFSKHFTGVALELKPKSDMQRTKPAPAISIKQLTGSIHGLGRSLGLIIALSLALQVFVLLSPFLMQWVVDQVLVSADRELLIVLGVGFGLALVMQVAIGVVRGSAVIYLSNKLSLQWTGNVFDHLIRLPLEFFERRHLGDVTSRMSSVQTIQRTLTTSFVEALIDGLMAIVTLGMMLLYSWKLALVTLAAVGIYTIFRALTAPHFRSGTESQLVAAAQQQTHLLESIRGIQSVKVAGREVHRSSAYRNLMNTTVNKDVRIARLGLGFHSASELIFGLERIVVIWIGATLAINNVFSVGMLIAYLAYKDQFAQRIATLIDKWVEFRMLRLHGERLADIVLSEPDVKNSSFQNQALTGPNKIEVVNLGYQYAPGEPWVVRNCTFVVEPGELVAIVGASGCGKTTLIKLILGLLKPVEGEVRIGGIPLEKLNQQQFREAVGAVMQNDQLFAGSVSENVAFSHEVLDEQRVQEVAKLAAVHSDIAAMPMGYNSLIGDMGTTLSGGQKQRIILARALYRCPKYLFLDEATSHLDVDRERLVNDAISKLALTRLIIAHRPETIASADRVLVMHGGAIMQEIEGSALRRRASETENEACA
ncbi:peptidase domain-containing ABC transporter [Xanthomonas oryzae]|uniref:peptidase domain-containing ABC transporter n=1 Tax=Xanthomonas oryzae TaxID=347 RepID=UPI002DEA4100|nr:peptidase domain-containing ABC transporter [Xanthomonas oryzae pv. oryzicola]MEC5114047.1 peptidase domain-containing ABC transporter [Xanthomonas oryzae pv. oryzicola]